MWIHFVLWVNGALVGGSGVALYLWWVGTAHRPSKGK